LIRRLCAQVAKGLNGPAVTTLMSASGQTHGGFYRHFGSRDDFVVEAMEKSFQEVRDRLIAAAKQAEPGEGWKAMVKSYLVLEHCNRADEGCPIAPLAPDVARTRPKLMRRISAIPKLRQELLPFMPGRNRQEKCANFFAIFSSMVGTIAIARTMPDLAVRRTILNTVRDRLLESFLDLFCDYRMMSIALTSEPALGGAF
jgi:TetR/AcrR family transcriptional regulator, transcriptional repressor for nem operon